MSSRYKKTYILMLLICISMPIYPCLGYNDEIIISNNGIIGTTDIEKKGNTYIFQTDITQPIVIQQNDIILDGNGYSISVSSDDAIEIITQFNITIKNLNFVSGKYGVHLTNSSRCNIYDNNITGIAYDGIKIEANSSINNVYNNYIYESGREGIAIRGDCKEMNIYDNKIIRNDRLGILIEKSKQCKIYNNEIIDQKEIGLLLAESTDCKIYRNYFDGNNQGIQLLVESKYNEIYENHIIESDDDAIELNDSHNNTIKSNIITDNDDDGIDLEESENNTIIKNDVYNNAYGIDLDKSPNNVIYNNNFDNSFGARYSLYKINTWNKDPPIGGNYWNDYEGIDENGDGLGDSPHVLFRDTFGKIDEMNMDHQPLMEKYVRTSHITLDIDYNSIYPDETISVEGQLTPVFDIPTELTIFYKSPSGTTHSETVVTNNEGEYDSSFQPSSTGTFEITSYWESDQYYAESTSDIQILSVNDYEIYAELSDESVTEGDTVSISGRIVPPRSDETITGKIVRGNEVTSMNIMTDSQGRYEYSFTAAVSGDWDLEVTWKTASSTLSLLVDEVEEPVIEEPEVEEPEGGNGIPIPVASIFVGILFVTSILRFLKNEDSPFILSSFI